jgi:hypothetical protein
VNSKEENSKAFVPITSKNSASGVENAAAGLLQVCKLWRELRSFLIAYVVINMNITYLYWSVLNVKNGLGWGGGGVSRIISLMEMRVFANRETERIENEINILITPSIVRMCCVFRQVSTK